MISLKLKTRPWHVQGCLQNSKQPNPPTAAKQYTIPRNYPALSHVCQTILKASTLELRSDGAADFAMAVYG